MWSRLLKGTDTPSEGVVPADAKTTPSTVEVKAKTADPKNAPKKNKGAKTGAAKTGGADAISVKQPKKNMGGRKKAIDSGSRATAIMKAMSNQQRLEILAHLMNGEERTVSELESTVKSLSQSALSQHLGRLRQDRIVKTRRDSQMIFYSLEDRSVERILKLLSGLYGNDPALPIDKDSNS